MRGQGYYSINYDDGTDSFTSIELSCGKKKKFFDHPDPVIAWFEFKKFIYEGRAKHEMGIDMLVGSSSTDHWFMDTNTYKERYLKEAGDNSYEFMTWEEIMNLTISEMNECIKVVAHKDMQSFQEVRDYYKKFLEGLSLSQRLKRAGVKTIHVKDVENTFGKRSVRNLKYMDKTIPRPIASKCVEVVKREFDINI